MARVAGPTRRRQGAAEGRAAAAGKRVGRGRGARFPGVPWGGPQQGPHHWASDYPTKVVDLAPFLAGAQV